MEIFDISKTLKDGLAVWPGDPEFRLNPVLRIKKGHSSNVLAVHMGTHTGTHIDAPLHVDDSGSDVTGVPILPFIGPARVFAISAEKCLEASDLFPLDWRGVERVLFKTRASRIPEYLFDQDFVYLSEEASEFLAKKKILLVGTDAPSVDPFGSVEFRSHKLLIGSGAAILEGIRLGDVPDGDYNLVCLPLKLAGADGSPVRAILWRA
jgi:arylformamidase